MQPLIPELLIPVSRLRLSSPSVRPPETKARTLVLKAHPENTFVRQEQYPNIKAATSDAMSCCLYGCHHIYNPQDPSRPRKPRTPRKPHASASASAPAASSELITDDERRSPEKRRKRPKSRHVFGHMERACARDFQHGRAAKAALQTPGGFACLRPGCGQWLRDQYNAINHIAANKPSGTDLYPCHTFYRRLLPACGCGESVFANINEAASHISTCDQAAAIRAVPGNAAILHDAQQGILPPEQACPIIPLKCWCPFPPCPFGRCQPYARGASPELLEEHLLTCRHWRDFQALTDAEQAAKRAQWRQDYRAASGSCMRLAPVASSSSSCSSQPAQPPTAAASAGLDDSLLFGGDLLSFPPPPPSVLSGGMSGLTVPLLPSDPIFLTPSLSPLFASSCSSSQATFSPDQDHSPPHIPAPLASPGIPAVSSAPNASQQPAWPGYGLELLHNNTSSFLPSATQPAAAAAAASELGGTAGLSLLPPPMPASRPSPDIIPDWPLHLLGDPFYASAESAGMLPFDAAHGAPASSAVMASDFLPDLGELGFDFGLAATVDTHDML